MSDTFDLREWIADGRASLATLNSLTKYPSIPTYHPLGERGQLRDEDPVTFDGVVDLTEKIDGTNARIIVLPDGTTVIGSREELLHARGDLVHSSHLGIVDALARLNLVRDAHLSQASPGLIRVIYGEVYGHGVGPAGRRYAGGSGKTGFRACSTRRTCRSSTCPGIRRGRRRGVRTRARAGSRVPG